MKKLFLIYLIIFSRFLIAQDSLKMKTLFHWDDDSIKSYQSWGTPPEPQQYNEIWGYYDSLKNKEYAIIGSAEGTYFWDVTNPSIAYIADYELGKDTAEIHRDFKTYKNYCYGVADEGQSSLQIFDMSYLPDSVKKVYDSNEHVIRSHNLFIEGGRLFICTPDYVGSTSHLKIMDIATDPETPVLLGDLILKNGQGNHVHDLFVKGDTAYCSNGYTGLFIYNISDPQNITLISSLTSYQDKDYNHSSWLSEDSKTLYFVDEDHGMGIKAYNVEDLTDMKFESIFRSNFGAMPHNVFVKGYKLYVSYYHDGVYVFDISDPTNPTTIAYYDTYEEKNGYDSYQGSWGVYPYLPSGNILVSDFSNGLFVLKDSSVANTPNNIISQVKSNLEIFPNPVYRNAFINFPKDKKIEKVIIVDLLGKIVYSENLKNNYSTLGFNFSFLDKGTYYFLVEGVNYNNTIKFVKQ